MVEIVHVAWVSESEWLVVLSFEADALMDEDDDSGPPPRECVIQIFSMRILDDGSTQSDMILEDVSNRLGPTVCSSVHLPVWYESVSVCPFRSFDDIGIWCSLVPTS